MEYKNKVVEDLFSSKKFNNLLTKVVNKQFRDDIKQEYALHLLEKSEKDLKKIESYILYYTYGYFKNQTHSNTSPFYTKFRDFTAELEFEPVDDINDDREDFLKKWMQDLEKIDTLLNREHWLDSYLFKLYYFENNSYRQIEKLHKIKYKGVEKHIPYTTIRDRVVAVLKRIKKDL